LFAPERYGCVPIVDKHPLNEIYISGILYALT